MKKRTKYSLAAAMLTLTIASPLITDVTTEAASCKLNKTSTTLQAGKTCNIKLNNCKKKITWSSSNPKVATVSKNGKVCAVKKGTTTICAKVNSKKYKCKVTVKKKGTTQGTAQGTTQGTTQSNGQCTNQNTGSNINSILESINTGNTNSFLTSCPNTNGNLIPNTNLNSLPNFIINSCPNNNNNTNTVPNVPNNSVDNDTTVDTDSPVGNVTENSAYNILNSLRSTYKEGTTLTNDYYYYSPVFGNGYGCYGFAAKLSDTVFGTSKTYTTHNSFDKIKVADNIRIGNSHSVIVLTKDSNSITVVEGNYNSSIHWDRKITASSLSSSGFTVYTRY